MVFERSVDWNRITNGMQATPVFRYAETLLIYAEAKAELGEASQTVIDQTINAIRGRVGMPLYRWLMCLTTLSLMLPIRNIAAIHLRHCYGRSEGKEELKW
ncbi:RagB/SusD family nutrient uptake outer membrane protein [Niabella defluvii]|nr:RagB/SusD family nutrient uptake outer membrane protein [Niabella sp. I65]